MKIKAIYAALVGAVAISGATAGEWCPPAPSGGKCAIEDCPDIGASISVGYESDYIFYGARLANDAVWADINYTFDCLPLPVTVGIWHLSAFGAPDDVVPAFGGFGFGDETDFYASVGLPSICGFDANLTYTAYTYPTRTYGIPVQPNGSPFDTHHELALEISRQIWCGITASYRVAHDFDRGHLDLNGDPQGAWMHTLGLAKSFDISDCVGLDLSGGVLYSDNYWVNGSRPGTFWQNDLDSGLNNYYIQAALPIALSCRATFTPYVGYSGTPDTWVLDGSNSGLGNTFPHWGQNANDVFHYGFSIGVDF